MSDAGIGPSIAPDRSADRPDLPVRHRLQSPPVVPIGSGLIAFSPSIQIARLVF
jgi:hypothetical protein